MTCQEAIALLNKGPLDCTTAERVACVRHLKSCDGCATYLEELITSQEEGVRKKLGEEKFAEVNELANELASRIAGTLMDKDARDPEGYNKKGTEKCQHSPRV